MANKSRYTRKSLPTTQIKVTLAHLRVERARLAAKRAGDPSDPSVICDQIDNTAAIRAAEREIRARTTA